MFRSATTRLTLWYLAIIMTLSIIFSWAIYNASVRELYLGFRRQANAVEEFSRFRGMPAPTNVTDAIQTEWEEARQRLGVNLFLVNVGVLIVAGGASYLLSKRTLRPIEEALEAQSRFTADASHELRTPLTAMKTEIEVSLRDGKLTVGEAKELLESNLEEISKLEALSNGLLTLARQDGAPTVVEPLSLAAVTDEAIGRLNKLIQQQKIKVSNQVDPINVMGDRQSLVELVVILLDNAIKYSAAGSRVALTSERHGHSGWLIVSDKGQGIKASDIPHIFERFYRADSSRSKDTVTGYGLGLSIAKQIVDSHHGTIEVSSTLSEGTTFTVKLPLATTNTPT